MLSELGWAHHHKAQQPLIATTMQSAHLACCNPWYPFHGSAQQDVRRVNSDGFETALKGCTAHRETAAKFEPPQHWDTME